MGSELAVAVMDYFRFGQYFFHITQAYSAAVYPVSNVLGAFYASVCYDDSSNFRCLQVFGCKFNGFACADEQGGMMP